MSEKPTTRHAQRLALRMQDAEFAREYKQARSEIDQVDALIRRLDQLRDDAGMSKAELARRTGRNPSAIRRLFTTKGASPEITLVVEIASALGAEIEIRPRRTRPADRARVVA